VKILEGKGQSPKMPNRVGRVGFNLAAGGRNYAVGEMPAG
jgi:hypothetical protein